VAAANAVSAEKVVAAAAALVVVVVAAAADVVVMIVVVVGVVAVGLERFEPLPPPTQPQGPAERAGLNAQHQPPPSAENVQLALDTAERHTAMP
jgi:hypothetical protein